jgi:hypothetical protein
LGVDWCTCVSSSPVTLKDCAAGKVSGILNCQEGGIRVNRRVVQGREWDGVWRPSPISGHETTTAVRGEGPEGEFCKWQGGMPPLGSSQDSETA